MRYVDIVVVIISEPPGHCVSGNMVIQDARGVWLSGVSVSKSEREFSVRTGV